MAEKGSKKAKRKPARDGADSVLASLPATRPNRMGARHRDGAATTAKAAEGTRARATPAKASEAAAAAAKATKRAAKKADTTKATTAKAKLAATPIAEGAAPRPKPVRSASKNLAAPAKNAAAKRVVATAPDKQPSGTELVTTVVQAAGELAQVGLSIGGQVLKRAVDRLPKP